MVFEHELSSPDAEQVPTAVDAGTSETSSLDVRSESLWLLAMVGGLSLMGAAAWRRRKAANR